MVEDTVIVRILTRIEEAFQDISGAEIGPFDVGDIVNLSRRNAEALIDRGVAEPIQIPSVDVPPFLRASEITQPTSPVPEAPAGYDEWVRLHPDFFNDSDGVEIRHDYYRNLVQPIHISDAVAQDNIENDAEINAENQEIRREARLIYTSGRFMDYCRSYFLQKWVNDKFIFETLMVAFANNFVANSTDGINPFINGKSGLGKSESAKLFITTVPDEYVVSGSLTKRALLYSEQMRAGSIIFQDDHVPDEIEAELHRSIMSSWATGTNHFTVEKLNGVNTLVRKRIPSRIIKLLTNAESISRDDNEGQDTSRYVTLEIDKTPENMRAIVDFIDRGAPELEHEKQVIRAMWNLIINERPLKNVIIPFKIFVKDNAIFKVREYKRFRSYVMGIALLCGRTTARKSDFEKARELWSYTTVMTDNETAGLNKTERAVYSKMKELSRGGIKFSLSALISSMGENTKAPNIYRALRGKTGTFENPSGGILTKTRGVLIQDHYDHESGYRDKIISLSYIKGTSFDESAFPYEYIEPINQECPAPSTANVNV